MSHDIRSNLRRDIRKFKRTGKLPKDWDVMKGKARYWDWVESRNQGREPHAVNGVEPVEPLPPQESQAAKLLRAWRTGAGFRRLSLRHKQAFVLVWVKGMSQEETASAMKISQARVAQILTVLRRKIAVAIKLHA